MCDQDEVQRLIQRTRANRERLNKQLQEFGESPHPIRSPLREKNQTPTTTSPSKLIRTSTFTKSDIKPTPSSPTRIRTNALINSPASKRSSSSDNDSFKETINKEVSESRRTIENSPVREGNKETYTRTTITEKEEKIHKTEHIKFSQIVDSNGKPINARERLKSLASKFGATVDDDSSQDEEIHEQTTTKTVTERTRSRSRSPSPGRKSPVKNDSPFKRSPSRKSTTFASPIISSSNRTFDRYDEDTFSPSGRKSRLNALASKFKKYDDEDNEVASIVENATNDLNVTKEVDVDEELEAIEDMERIQANTPKVNNKDPNFVKNLKAQGYEESSSKSKLVYDFQKQGSSPMAKPTILSSPTKNAAEPRPTSPHKPHPLQFISPQVNKALAKGSPSKAQRPESPKKMAERSVSPHKLHPHQFISPQTSSPRKPPVSEPPSKPIRTWALAQETMETPKVAPPPPPKPPSSEPMTDTASRKSMSEKWSMFEKQTTQEVSPQVDPAMMSLSERRALFEKNRSAPKPIARFGEAVTPSMLMKGQGQYDIRSQPKQLFTTPRPPSPRRVSPERPKSPIRARSPMRSNSPVKMVLKENWKKESPSPPRENKRDQPEDDTYPPSDKYPGIGSLKRIKVSPPKPGQLYPQIEDASSEDDRPGTSMSVESEVPSEAPSLGAAIKRAANAARMMEARRMPAISEDRTHHDDDEMMDSEAGDIDDMLDEALDDSHSTRGPTPPKARRIGLSPTASAASWEFQTPVSTAGKKSKDFKTPLVEGLQHSPQGPMPAIEGDDGTSLTHTVSFYRRQKPVVTFTPHEKIVRNAKMDVADETEDKLSKEALTREIHKLQDEVEEQRQRMEQASKAINLCVSRGEFEGSDERVKAESVLLEATHKYTAATAEIKRLTTEGAIGKLEKPGRPMCSSKGSISFSGVALPLKPAFLQMIRKGGDETVHYFVILVKYRSRVIATQMLSTESDVPGDGIRNGKLNFPNLINLRDLDIDFQIHLEVYGLQTRKEHIEHDVKYHIRKEKSMFNLTPLKKLKKQESSPFPRNQNPVNSKTIRRPAFGMVGYAIINMQTLKNRAFRLDKVPDFSPLEGGLEMTLTIHSESKIEERGFLTLFTDVNGYGDWCRRWCRLSGNTLHFWKYPEDETKQKPCEQISLSHCITGEVTLAPREVCSRMNTFMVETERSIRQGDQDTLTMHVSPKTGRTIIKHLLSADTRDERIGWCQVVNRALENIRAWDPNAFRPRTNSESSVTSGASGASAAPSSTSTDIW